MQCRPIAGGVLAAQPVASPKPAQCILARGWLAHCHSLAPPGGTCRPRDRAARGASQGATAAASSRGAGEASSGPSSSSSHVGPSPASSSSSSSARGASGSSSLVVGSGAPPRRIILPVETGQSTINWERYMLLAFEREKLRLAQGGEAAGEAEEAEAVEEEEAADAFALRLAGSDLSAAYFRRWDDPAVHQPMLQDRVLVAAWREALEAAPAGALEGKVVLDVGCGLGLLSMLAAKAGAARVVAVDGSAGAVEAARRIIRANGLQDKITVVHGALEELESLPGVSPGGVDVVLSNWMGPGLLAGGMVNTMAHAAGKWLRPGGLVLPDRVTLWAAGLEDRDALQDSKEAWSRVGGLDMSAALAQVIKHPRRDVLTRKTQLLSAPQRLADWDMAALRPGTVLDPESGAYARCPFRLAAVREERLFGLVLFWEAAWTFGGALAGGDDAKPPVRFTTHPLSSTTHYQQLMVDFPRSVRLAADDEVAGELVLRPGATDPRDLELELAVAALPGGGQPFSAAYRVAHAGP